MNPLMNIELYLNARVNCTNKLPKYLTRQSRIRFEAVPIRGWSPESKQLRDIMILKYLMRLFPIQHETALALRACFFF